MISFNKFLKASALIVGTCLTTTAPYAIAKHEGAYTDPVSAAVALSNRSPENRARDIYRHPEETLKFFGVTREQTLAELIPGGGWYAEILAPLLREKGHYIGLQPAGGMERLKTKFAETPALYDKAALIAWPEGTAEIAPGSIDTILTFRNVHNLVMKDGAPAAFAIFFKLLKPGGVLGVVDHRLPEERDSAMEKTSGYLKVSTVRKLAEDAGFVLEAQSEINANPKDTADWEKGVWTLPPSLRHGEIDRDKYVAIGESDRMTLRFRKPKG